MLHELHLHAGLDLGPAAVTELPLAYGIFCATYDWCLVAYFHSRRGEWTAAWKAR